MENTCKTAVSRRSEKDRQPHTDEVFQDYVPSDDESPEFANRDVGVHVSGAGFGDAGTELGVAQRGQHRGKSGDKERQNDSRTGHFRRHCTR